VQEINLLQNSLKEKNQSWQRRSGIALSILIFILIFELVLSAMFYFLGSNRDKQITRLADENAALQNKMENTQKGLEEAKKFQRQLASLKDLIQVHVYWSKFFDEMESKIYVKSKLDTMNVDEAGTVTISGQVSSYSELGKLILALNKSKNLTNIKLLNSSLSDSEKSGVFFSLNAKVNKEAFTKTE